MNLLSTAQIAQVLEARLTDYKVSCSQIKQDRVSIVLTDIHSKEIYGVSGIRPSEYRGRYGATILAKNLLEGVQHCRDQCSPRHDGNVIPFSRLRRLEGTPQARMSVLTLITQPLLARR
jgi:hypothetical protein